MFNQPAVYLCLYSRRIDRASRDDIGKRLSELADKLLVGLLRCCSAEKRAVTLVDSLGVGQADFQTCCETSGTTKSR